MSTDLYGIRVQLLEPGKKKVSLKVFVVYYDTENKSHQPLPKDHSFFLRILWDKGDVRFANGGPIGKEISVEQYLDEKWVDENTHRYIERVEQVSQTNVEDYGTYRDFYYEHAGRWEDEDKLVQADYEVYVTDARYLEHLEDGMSWGTTAYETNAVTLSRDYAEILPDLSVPCRRLEPFIGEKEKGTPATMTFNADGSLLMVVSQVNEIAVFNANTGRETWRDSTAGMFADVNTDARDTIVWLRSYGEILKVWDIASGKESPIIPKTNSKLMSPLGNVFVEFGEDEYLRFMDKDGKENGKIRQPDCVEAVAFTADDAKIALGGLYNTVSIWDTRSRKKITDIPVGERTESLAFDSNGDFLTVTHARSITIYKIDTLEVIFNYPFPGKDFVGAAIWSPDCKYFAVNIVNGGSGYGGHVNIYELAGHTG
ncbi:MAG: WD40 repeat domain-containing protein [bacterium]|nr:WD40 repeat domain-containing protein [bacterium]